MSLTDAFVSIDSLRPDMHSGRLTFDQHRVTKLVCPIAVLERGYSDDEVRGVLGGNFLRTAGEVWTAKS